MYIMRVGDKASEPSRTEVEVELDKNGAFYLDADLNPIAPPESEDADVAEIGERGFAVRNDGVFVFFTDTDDYDEGKRQLAEAITSYLDDIGNDYGLIMKIIVENAGVALSEEENEFISLAFKGDFEEFFSDITSQFADILLDAFSDALATAQEPYEKAIAVLTEDKPKTSPPSPSGKDGLVFKLLGE